MVKIDYNKQMKGNQEAERTFTWFRIHRTSKRFIFNHKDRNSTHGSFLDCYAWLWAGM